MLCGQKDDDQKTSVGRLLSNVCTKVAGVGTRLFVRVAVFLSVPVGPGLVVPVWCSLLLLSYHGYGTEEEIDGWDDCPRNHPTAKVYSLKNNTHACVNGL